MGHMCIGYQLIHSWSGRHHGVRAIGVLCWLNCFCGVEAAEFIRGDGNEDGALDITDPVTNLEYQFLGLHNPGCLSALDTNADAVLDITDPVYNLEHQCPGESAPPPPFPTCGPDSALDGLACESHAACPFPTVEGFTLLGPNDQGYTEYEHDQTGIVFVLLPGGTFWMGAQADFPDWPNYDPDVDATWEWLDVRPVHQVTLSPFLIAKYELTQGQWLEVMGENPSWFQPGGGGESNLPPELLQDAAWLELPVEQVSWDDIQGFEQATGLKLPSEAQWEYACRARTSTPFSFGAARGCNRSSCDPCPEVDPFMW